MRDGWGGGLMVKVGASVLLPDFPDVPQPSAFKAALPPLMAANETIFHAGLPCHKACQAAFFFSNYRRVFERTGPLIDALFFPFCSLRASLSPQSPGF